ncbi:MAG: hypothetical protein R6V11_08215 [Ectothiorhodospiraceae bacterium]
MPAMFPSISAVPSRYQVTIRSFHPDESFEEEGLWFRGDDRGFSTQPNDKVTSRIYYSMDIDLAKGQIAHRHIDSDESVQPHFGLEYEYTDHGPEEEIKWKEFVNGSDGVHVAWISGRYRGTNHAVPLSEWSAEWLGSSFVPSIHVHYELAFIFDGQRQILDFIANLRGNAYPNHEVLIRDLDGRAIFVGGHVRSGTAYTQLGDSRANSNLLTNAVRIGLNASGRFDNQVAELDPGQRWLGGHHLDDARYRSVEAWNKEYRDLNPNAGHSTGLGAALGPARAFYRDLYSELFR